MYVGETNVISKCWYSRRKSVWIWLKSAFVVPLVAEPAVVDDDVLVTSVQEASVPHLLRLGAYEVFTAMSKTVLVLVPSSTMIMTSSKTYLRQLLGSFSQSTLHLNRSQVIHPMGGVRARPLSKLRPTSPSDKISIVRSGLMTLTMMMMNTRLM